MLIKAREMVRQLFREDITDNSDKENVYGHFQREKEKIKKYFQDQANADALRLKRPLDAPGISKIGLSSSTSKSKNMVQFTIEKVAPEQASNSELQMIGQETINRDSDFDGHQMENILIFNSSSTKVIKIKFV